MKLVSGQTVVTAGVASDMKDGEFNAFVLESLCKHFNGDWGESLDKEANDSALLNKDDRMIGVYSKEGLEKIWIITEWDRSVTTVLFPDEY